MKLLIRFSTQWGNYITSLTEISDLSTYNEIKKNVESKFGIKTSYQLLKYKRDGYTVIICLKFKFYYII